MAKLVDMEMDDERQFDHAMPFPMERARYPYGLRICLGPDEMKKLGLDIGDCEREQLVTFCIEARVTVVHDEKHSERVELQIEKMAVDSADGDDDEDDEAEKET